LRLSRTGQAEPMTSFGGSLAHHGATCSECDSRDGLPVNPEILMHSNAVENWHKLLESRDPAGLDALLDDDVCFYSPVVHTPQRGKFLTTLYLAAALQVFVNETFHYTREIVGARDAALEFSVVIDGITVNGVDMMKWNDEGRIVEFKVMVRPLKAIQLIHQKMAAMLESMKA
jgi:hypothetical protein